MPISTRSFVKNSVKNSPKNSVTSVVSLSITALSISLSGNFWILLGATGGWLIHEAIAPRSVQASTERTTVTITRQSNENYQSMLRRAETAARAAVQRSFDREVLTTNVVVTVIGQNGGAITPMLSIEVSRQNWRTSPSPQQWATYFNEAQALLIPTATATTATPATTPRATPATTPRPAPVVGNPLNPSSINGTTPSSPERNVDTPSAEEELVIF
ncbi:MAG: hypothetical protein HC916_01035 [Coleofasciculaceae cyanobacterium SM2_1_6]|nr:hypothetical protein [Coleofasciculaceae cyanobacterium SM2_1_6]